MNVYDDAYALAKSLKESQENKQYLEAKEKLEKDEKAREMLMDFRKFQMELQGELMEGKQVDQEKSDRLKNMYEVLNMNLTVKEYLAAEYRFGKMITDVSKIIGEAVGLDKFEELTGGGSG